VFDWNGDQVGEVGIPVWCRVVFMLWYNGLVLHPCICVLVPVCYEMGWNPSGRDGDELFHARCRLLGRCNIRISRVEYDEARNIFAVDAWRA